ncbi:hypothetical protein M3Y95_01257600 [Aphelenchoides besseyi]|nr:hypothetical protein M3Y95_01257600 [Aphelenchoides besseyi]
MRFSLLILALFFLATKTALASTENNVKDKSKEVQKDPVDPAGSAAKPWWNPFGGGTPEKGQSSKDPTNGVNPPEDKNKPWWNPFGGGKKPDPNAPGGFELTPMNPTSKSPDTPQPSAGSPQSPTKSPVGPVVNPPTVDPPTVDPPIVNPPSATGQTPKKKPKCSELRRRKRFRQPTTVSP